MLSELAENFTAVDTTSDKNIVDGQVGLNSSILDDMKAARAVPRVERPGRQDDIVTLEFAVDDLYRSSFDGQSKAVSESRKVSEGSLAAGDGAIGDSGRPLTVKDQERDGTPELQMQVGDVISAAPPAERIEPGTGTQTEAQLKQL